MRTTAIVLTALMLSSCHSRVPIELPDSRPPHPRAAAVTELKVGDRVRVTLRNGNHAEARVAAVQREALVAEDGRRILYADIVQIEKTVVSKGKTIASVAGLVAIWFVLAYGAALGSLVGGGLGGG